MKFINCFLLLFIVPNYSFSQSKEILEDICVYEHKFGASNYLNKFNSYDFSSVWTKTNEQLVYGIIGKNHQRIRIKFISVERNPNNKNEYIIYGKSKVKSNIREFRGKITMRKILKTKELSYGVDDMYYKGKIKCEGVLIADYYFKEKKSEKGTGVFSGEVYSKWCIFKESENQISYDDINDYSDSYKNNMFIGVWKSYKTKKTKLCNWGDYRVPMANDDFDIGACCFSPSDKYLKFGWETYRKSEIENDKKAKQLESIDWWK